jgi:hypothetical protein
MYYWAAWFIALAIYLFSATVVSLSASLGWFALVVGLGSVYVFHFEFGRLMGFLRAHCPNEYATLQDKPFVKVLAFVHPSLIRRFWGPRQSPLSIEERALLVYRSAWLFTFVSLVVILIFANTMQ